MPHVKIGGSPEDEPPFPVLVSYRQVPGKTGPSRRDGRFPYIVEQKMDDDIFCRVRGAAVRD